MLSNYAIVMLSFSLRPSASLILGSLRASSSIPCRITRCAASTANDGMPLNTLTVPELKDLLRAQGLPVSGKKAELLDRLDAPFSAGIAQPANANREAASVLDSISSLADLAATNSPALRPIATAAAKPMKLNFLELQPGELVALLKSWGHPAYRAKQIEGWISKGVASFEDMPNIPRPLRDLLTAHLCLGTLDVAVEQVSKDGTVKRAYALPDGQLIESVLMPYKDGRNTACISSQAGCGMGCVFCATGQMGFARHLKSAEIFEQASRFAGELKQKQQRLSNVVMMGMGEPLANYDNVLAACRRISSELGIGARHITISTVGLAPRIRQLAHEPEQFTLAVSLHEASDATRSAIMPINRRYPIPELIDACCEYVDAKQRRVTFEWALINGVNDKPEVAHDLGRLLQPLRGKCHVNIIPLNPTGGFEGKPANPKALAEFVAVLETHGIGATPRVRRGIDIDAGCGQLSTRRKKQDDREQQRKALQQTSSSLEEPTAADEVAEAAPEADDAAALLRRDEAAAMMASGAPPSENAVAGGW